MRRREKIQPNVVFSSELGNVRRYFVTRGVWTASLNDSVCEASKLDQTDNVDFN